MTETAILTASPTGLGPCLCGQVVVNGDTIAVGSPQDSLGSLGSIEVYNKPAGGWQNASDPDALLYEPFGIAQGHSFQAIAMSDTGIVGSSHYFRNGAAQQVIEVFLKLPAGWTGNQGPQATLFSTRTDASFGSSEGSVAILGNTIVAGSLSPNFTNIPPSFVDVWVKPFSGWTSTTETAQLSDSSPNYQDGFGTSVAIAPIGILVGTPAAFKVGQNIGGATYVFSKPVGGWQTTSAPSQTLLNSDRTANDGFGSSVAADGSTIVVGAPFGPHSSQSGRAYIY